ncbi:MAG: hypothetical protein QM757_06485 [Paludibaculum sp.]
MNCAQNKIIYTSLASGDLELWQMKPDGSGKKQLTKREGYDGGAVFSRDGKKIVWRATDPNNAKAMARYKELLKENLTEPMKMELFIVGTPMTERRSSSSRNSAAPRSRPTFTPDGKQIIFSSNKHNCDGRRFELYRINTRRVRAATDH